MRFARPTLRHIRPANLARLWRDSRRAVISALVFVAAALLAVVMATVTVSLLERAVAREIAAKFEQDGLDWPELTTDGLLVYLSGEAGSEAERFRALSLASTVAAAERVIDQMSVKPSIAITAPRFSVEVLRNGVDVSVIGLVPQAYDIDALVRQIEAIGNEVSVVNMLESADYPVPFGWEQAVEFGLVALSMVPVSKISIAPDQVEIFGLAESTRERDDFRTRLTRARPRGLITNIDISAPRPAISPFTLRFVRDADGARFDACSADSVEVRAAILQAARQSGAEGVLECLIGLGSPSPRWQAAVVAAIRTVGDLGAGSVTFSDTDVSLVVPGSVAIDAFDTAVGNLKARLPETFSLQATRLLPEADSATDPDVEFVAALDEQGAVTLRGRLTDERLSGAVQALARSAFGMGAVDMQVNVDPDTPEGWPVRALLAVDVLARLEHGRVRLRPGQIDVTGVTGDKEASDKLSALLAEKLGQGAVFNLNLTYDERFDPATRIPTPARCEAWIAEILAKEQITFDPGSATIVAGARDVMDAIAEVLRTCGRIEMEVGGHTDSQGRLESNMRLSQSRAEAVIAGLLARGVPVSDLVAKGYGPEFPIADNGTASGREANRRIEFRLTGASAEAARAEAGLPVTATDAAAAASEPLDESALEITARPAVADTPRPKPRPARP
jgi:OmpA-OmpF porin, OOP family